MTRGRENQTGGIEVSVFSMKRLLYEDGVRVAGKDEMPDFWDICVRDANSNWIDGVEELTRPEEVDEALDSFREKYPDASMEYLP
jgi:hypothetical protein